MGRWSVREGVMTKKKDKRPAWRWLFHGDGRVAVIERLASGEWSVTIAGTNVGTFKSESAAEEFVRKLNTKIGNTVAVSGTIMVQPTVGV
jgi:hypothetical protein